MMRARPKRSLNVRPLLLVLLTTVLLGSANTAEAQTASEQTVEARKSPWVAFALSFFVIPGAGQAYNGQWGKGGLMLGGVVIFGGILLANVDECFFSSDGAVCGWTLAGYGGVGLFWVWSMIDAPLAAKGINRRIDAGQVSLEIGPQLIAPNRDSRFGLSLVRVRF